MKDIERIEIRDQYRIKVGDQYVRDYKILPDGFDSIAYYTDDYDFAKVFEFGTHQFDGDNNTIIKEKIDKLLAVTKGKLLLTRIEVHSKRTTREVDSIVSPNKQQGEVA